MDTRCHPGPSLSPSTASKTPSRQADGEAAQLLPGRAEEGKDRVGEVQRYTHTHSGPQPERETQTARQTQRERKRNTDTSHGRHTQTTHCPHSSDRPTPRFTHHFPNSDTELRESDSPRFTGIHKSHRYTQITSAHSKILSTHNSEYARSQVHKDRPNFQILRFTNTQVQRQCGPTQLLAPQIHVP